MRHSSWGCTCQHSEARSAPLWAGINGLFDAADAYFPLLATRGGPMLRARVTFAPLGSLQHLIVNLKRRPNDVTNGKFVLDKPTADPPKLLAKIARSDEGF